MGLFDKPFRKRQSLEYYREHFFRLTHEIVETSDSTYCEMLRLFSQRFHPVSPDGLGLFKAGLHAGVFMVYGYGQKTRCDVDEFNDMLNIASGLAVKGVLDGTAGASFDRSQATQIALPYAKKVLGAIADEIDQGPSDLGHQTVGFTTLVDLYHESLADSIAQYETQQRRELDPQVWGWVRSCVAKMAQEIVQR